RIVVVTACSRFPLRSCTLFVRGGRGADAHAEQQCTHQRNQDRDLELDHVRRLATTRERSRLAPSASTIRGLPRFSMSSSKVSAGNTSAHRVGALSRLAKSTAELLNRNRPP